MKQIAVTYRSHGKNQRGQLMIKPKGIIHIRAEQLLAQINDSLRQGYEVRLLSRNDECLRIYAMALSDWRIVPVAATMGAYREQMFADCEAKAVTKNGQEISQADHAKRAENESNIGKMRRKSAVPTRVVQCPSCGYEFSIAGFSNN